MACSWSKTFVTSCTITGKLFYLLYAMNEIVLRHYKNIFFYSWKDSSKPKEFSIIILPGFDAELINYSDNTNNLFISKSEEDSVQFKNDLKLNEEDFLKFMKSSIEIYSSEISKKNLLLIIKKELTNKKLSEISSITRNFDEDNPQIIMKYQRLKYLEQEKNYRIFKIEINQLINYKDIENKKLLNEIKQKDKIIEEKDEKINEKDNEKMKLLDKIEQKNEIIKQQDEIIKQKDEIIKQKFEIIKQKDNENWELMIENDKERQELRDEQFKVTVELLYEIYEIKKKNY